MISLIVIATIAPIGAAAEVPALHGRLYQTEGRAYLSASLGGVSNDPFFRQAVLGLRAEYNLTQEFGGGVGLDYRASQNAPLFIVGDEPKPTFDRVAWGARAGLSWTPLYGKMNLLGELAVPFDAAFLLDAGVSGSQQGLVTVHGALGLRQRFFVGDRLAVSLTVEDQLGQVSRALRVEPVLEHEIIFRVGFGLFVPRARGAS